MTSIEEKGTMTKNQRQAPTMIPWLASALVVALVVSGCATEAKTLDPNQIERQYGVSGAAAHIVR